MNSYKVMVGVKARVLYKTSFVKQNNKVTPTLTLGMDWLGSLDLSQGKNGCTHGSI